MGEYTLSERRRRARVRATILAARDRPCVDCGIQLPPECMDLDHVRGVKLFTLNVTSAKRFAKAIIDAEIAKCDVRCPNCHRLRHHREGDHMERIVAGGGTPLGPEVDGAPTPKRMAAEARAARAHELDALGLSRGDIAAAVGVKPDTLRRRYGI